MILITGATGLLGSHILYELANAGKPVRAVYHNEAGIEKTQQIFEFYCQNAGQILEKVEWVQADINDYFAITRLLEGVTQVYHVAGLVSFDDHDKKELNKINKDGTANIVNACLEAGNINLCHVSSIATLGELENEQPVTEDIIWNRGYAASAYAISKHKGEMEVWRGMNEGLNAVIVNPSVIIGPGMWMGPGGTLFNAVNRGLKFYTEGSTGYVDVRDVATIMISLMENQIYGDRYILNAGDMSNREFLNLLSDQLGKKRPSVKLSDFMTKSAAAAEYVRAMITGVRPRFTMKSLKISSEKLHYSNHKIIEKLNFRFIPIEKSLYDAIQLYFINFR